MRSMSCYSFVSNNLDGTLSIGRADVIKTSQVEVLFIILLMKYYEDQFILIDKGTLSISDVTII